MKIKLPLLLLISSVLLLGCVERYQSAATLLGGEPRKKPPTTTTTTTTSPLHPAEPQLPAVPQPSISDEQAKTAIAAMKKKLLASSVRPPYLLMRRLTMLQQLGEISATALPERTIAVTQFCQGLSHALPEEKPLIMTSPAWQDAFCRSGKGKVHEQAHGLGLTYGLRELEFFEKIAAAVSHKGQLRVKIPPQDLSEKDVWIKLEPQPDVAAGIWQTTLEIAGGSVTADFLNPMIGAPSPAELQTYLCTSLLGETSFSVGNGYMKVLQLPSGHYRYTLYELPEDDANWAPAKAQKSSHGTIDWLRANPHPVIASLSGPQDDESTLVER